MAKLSATIFAIVLSILLITIGFVIVGSIELDTELSLYSSISPTTIDNTYFSLVTWNNRLDNGTYLKLKTTAVGTIYMGNSSVCALPTGVRSINNATWTFHYYGVTNSTKHTTFFVNGTIVDADEELVETLFTESAESDPITAANATYTATVQVAEFDINQTAMEECGPYYLKIDWLTNSDGEDLTVDLLHDTATDGSFTYISGIDISYGVPSYLDAMISLVGIVTFFAIVIFTVESMKKE